MKDKLILQVGLSGFPKGTAAVSRCLMLNGLAVKSDYQVLWLNNKPCFQKTKEDLIKSHGHLSGIEYIYTSGTAYKSSNFIIRRIINLKGLIFESLKLFYSALTSKNILLILYPKGTILQLIRYRFISLITNTPLIIHYVEYRSAHKSRKRFDLKINDYLFDNFIHKFSDGFIPISTYLENKINTKKIDSKRIFRLPSIVDFGIFAHISKYEQTIDSKYFLFCGGLGYQDSLSLILKSFKKISSQNNYRLVLVISGSKAQISKLVEDISLYKLNERVEIHSFLDYETLLIKYYHASALLVPLRNNLQDIARFPQKISEYSASGNPIITHNVGDISIYFENEKSALIANLFDVNSFSSKMQFVIDNPVKAKEIGLNGKKVGIRYFDSNSYSEPFNDFLNRFF